MERIDHTRLRFVTAKTPQSLEAFVNSLPFKIEIKELLKTGKTYELWFILPEEEHISFKSGSVDGQTEA